MFGKCKAKSIKPNSPMDTIPVFVPLFILLIQAVSQLPVTASYKELLEGALVGTQFLLVMVFCRYKTRAKIKKF